ncbi:hypothetical protein ACM26V_13545 [Salipaludibacillus sp. HK11]|uniref:hypothetical protein n=1 Tax=Salipaludibacillus sp. HK11 TaxID=3394320 RepID=UPI0039FDD1AD
MKKITLSLVSWILAMGIVSHATDQTEASEVKKHINEGESLSSSLEGKNTEEKILQTHDKNESENQITVEWNTTPTYTFEAYLQKSEENNSASEQHEKKIESPQQGEDDEGIYLEAAWHELDLIDSDQDDLWSSEESFFTVLDSYELAETTRNL